MYGSSPALRTHRRFLMLPLRTWYEHRKPLARCTNVLKSVRTDVDQGEEAGSPSRGLRARAELSTASRQVSGQQSGQRVRNKAAVAHLIECKCVLDTLRRAKTFFLCFLHPQLKNGQILLCCRLTCQRDVWEYIPRMAGQTSPRPSPRGCRGTSALPRFSRGV